MIIAPPKILPKSRNEIDMTEAALPSSSMGNTIKPAITLAGKKISKGRKYSLR